MNVVYFYTCLLLFMIIPSFVSFAQEKTDNIQDVILPPPSVFQFSNYGGTQVSEFNGSISPSIPIYEYVVGQLRIPINLSYSGNGVKIDQRCGWTGVNWNLNAGGAITRLMRDIPDESTTPNDRVFLSQEILESYDYSHQSPDIQYLNQIEAYKQFDTQVDIFTFNFCGYSGSFYLDQQMQPVLMNRERELKIGLPTYDLGGLINGFVITTPDGIMYYFGEDETEYIKSNLFSANRLTVTTAFYLRKIVNPLTSDEINFQYNTENEYVNIVGVSQEIYNTLHGSCISDPGGACSLPIDLDYFSRVETKNVIIGEKYLASLSNNRNKLLVDFESKSIEAAEYKRILTGLSINNSGRKLLNVKLDYIKDDQRFFLETCTLNRSPNNTHRGNGAEIFTMEYKNPLLLPDLFSFSQDHLGYFNDKNNFTLLPKTEEIIFDAVNDQLADREPLFEYATYGTLTKIHYPTGGFTSFEYEAPQLKTDDVRTIRSELSNLWPGILINNLDATLYLNEFCDPEDPDCSGSQNGTFKDQELDLNVQVQYLEEGTPYYNLEIKLIDITNSQNSVVEERILSIRNHGNIDANGLYSFQEQVAFNLTEGQFYKVELDLVPTVSNPSNLSPIKINANLDYVNGETRKDGSGIRIKRVLDFKSQNAVPEIKRYYYTTAKNIENVFEEDFFKFSYRSYIHNSYQSLDGGSGIFNIMHLKSSFISNCLRGSSNTQWYPDITISFGGDSFENGGIQKGFSHLTQNQIVDVFHYYDFYEGNENMDSYLLKTYLGVTNNLDTYSGKILTERYLSKHSDGLFITKKKVYEYSETVTNSVTNTLIDRVMHFNSWVPDYSDITGLFIGFYKTNSITLKLESTSTIDFLGLVPLQEEANANTITKRTDYSYGQFVGLPTKTSEVSSNNNFVLNTEYIYPTRNISFQDLSAGENSLYNLLFIYHVLSKPILVTTNKENISNNSKMDISKRRIVYGDNYFPKLIQTSYGSELLANRIHISKYDSKGNIQEQSLDNNVLHAYYWGYNDQYPIVKGENVNFSTGLEPAINAARKTINSTTYASVDEYLENLGSFFYLDGTLDNSKVTSWNNFMFDINQALPNAQLTFYTYDPFIGMTSQTDPAGITTYYEYDDFGRLESIKDQNGDIVKAYDYHYMATAEPPELSVPTPPLTFSNSAGTKSVNVTSNVSWTASDNASWISVSPTSSSGDGSISITTTSNNTVFSRTGTVTVQENDGSGVASQQISITQNGATPILSASPTSLTYTDDGGSKTINITSNVSWAVTDNQSWLSVNPTSGSGSGSVSITALPNSGSSRPGMVTIDEKDGTAVPAKQIAITQQAYTSTLDVSTTYLTFPGAITKTFTITSEVSWNISIHYFNSGGWLSVSQTSGNGNATISVTSLNVNTRGELWEAEIQVSGGGMYRVIDCIK